MIWHFILYIYIYIFICLCVCVFVCVYVCMYVYVYTWIVCFIIVYDCKVVSGLPGDWIKLLLTYLLTNTSMLNTSFLCLCSRAKWVRYFTQAVTLVNISRAKWVRYFPHAVTLVHISDARQLESIHWHLLLITDFVNLQSLGKHTCKLQTQKFINNSVRAHHQKYISSV